MTAKSSRQNPALRKTPRRASSRRPTAEVWKEEMARAAALTAKPYTLDGRYEEGEKVDHRSFGLGMVKRLISPDKMEVLFEDELKVMIRAVAPPPPPEDTPRRMPRRTAGWARRMVGPSARATAQDQDIQ